MDWSLVMSTLLYNVHIWSKFEGRARSMVNAMYNKVRRRAYGSPRYEKCDITDVGVRIALDAPSLDCKATVCRSTSIDDLTPVPGAM